MIGVVLAGGLSTRMGMEKAFLPAEPSGLERLLSRQTRLLQDVGLGQVFLSLRRDMICPDPSLDVLYDAEDGLGPLSGIVAAMRRQPNRHLLVLAVDMAHVDIALLTRLIRRSSDTNGVAPRVSGRWEPLCAIYPPSTLERAEELLRGPRRSPAALVSELAARGVMAAYPVRDDEAAQLRSWNLPEDVPTTLRRQSEILR